MSNAWHATVAGFPKVTLTFRVNAAGDKVDLLVRLSENRNPSVREQVGADEAEMVLDARCSKPALLPPEIQPGMTAQLELNGVKGTARLVPVVDPRHTSVVKATGQKIRLVWSTDAVAL